MDAQEVDYRDTVSQQTGSHESESLVITCPFDRYEVLVRLRADGEFLGIVGVSVNRDFLDNAQKLCALKALGYHDVDDFYREPEEV